MAARNFKILTNSRQSSALDGVIRYKLRTPAYKVQL